ncbi:MAG: membrane protein insertion efficiency factor YidD [Magnetococcales bacterium]|nr:membrane protein insertion efficiency factor YidD [Magnetococcales bacterium]
MPPPPTIGLVIALLTALGPLRTTWAADEAVNPLAYRPATPQQHPPESDATNALTPWLLFPLSLYSHTISRVDGDRCPSHPNCSHYARQALQRHGPLTGLWLTIDRLIHERSEIELAPQVRAEDGSTRLLDPLEANDFWLHQPWRENP